ncbi:hypothetical protein KI387_017028, partial [Taxus chinensis]
ASLVDYEDSDEEEKMPSPPGLSACVTEERGKHNYICSEASSSSSSWTPIRNHFIGMGYSALVVDEAIHEVDCEEQEEVEVKEATQNHDLEEDSKNLDNTLATLVGAPRYHPFWVRGDLQRQKVTVLIDNGATHNFIDESLVVRMGLKVEDFKGFNVTVANGYSLPCTRKIPQVNITLGRH